MEKRWTWSWSGRQVLPTRGRGRGASRRELVGAHDGDHAAARAEEDVATRRAGRHAVERVVPALHRVEPPGAEGHLTSELVVRDEVRAAETGPDRVQVVPRAPVVP